MDRAPHHIQRDQEYGADGCVAAMVGSGADGGCAVGTTDELRRNEMRGSDEATLLLVFAECECFALGTDQDRHSRLLPKHKDIAIA